MTTRQGPGNGTPGLDHNTAESTPSVSRLGHHDRVKAHHAYWEIDAHYAALVDACGDYNARRGEKRAKVHPDRVIALLASMTNWARVDGVACDSTITQLVTYTRQREPWVKAALHVVTAMGLITPIDADGKPRVNGRGRGRRDRGTRRRLDYLIGNDAASQPITSTPEMVRVDASNGEGAHTTTTDEMVRVDARNGEAFRPPLMVTPLSEETSPLGETSAAEPQADDGSPYATLDRKRSQLKAAVIDAIADRNGVSPAAARLNFTSKIEMIVDGATAANWDGIDETVPQGLARFIVSASPADVCKYLAQLNTAS